MVPVISAVASAVPSVYSRADQMAKKLSGGKSLKSLVGLSDGPKLAGEVLVKSGLSIGQLKSLMDNFAPQHADEVYQHAVNFVSAEVQAVSAIAAKPVFKGPVYLESDVFCIQIKEVITALGLRNVSELMKVATVLNTITADQVRAYKDKGALNPRLGYN